MPWSPDIHLRHSSGLRPMIMRRATDSSMQSSSGARTITSQTRLILGIKTPKLASNDPGISKLRASILAAVPAKLTSHKIQLMQSSLMAQHHIKDRSTMAPGLNISSIPLLSSGFHSGCRAYTVEQHTTGRRPSQRDPHRGRCHTINTSEQRRHRPAPHAGQHHNNIRLWPGWHLAGTICLLER